MPIVTIIMPHTRCMSSNLWLYLSVPTLIYPPVSLLLDLGRCGVFTITQAAQFALQVILISSANRVF
jgi:hypothetical protein